MLSLVQNQNNATTILRKVLDGNFTDPLLLVGPDGVGKSYSVRILTRMLFCRGTQTEDCKCPHCMQLKEGVHPDFHLLSPEDGKDLGIEAIRNLISEVASFPLIAKYQVVLIEHVDRMTSAAANALLKTLEEPPKKARFFLTTTSLDRVLSTIQSRCAPVAYNRLPEKLVLTLLQSYEKDSRKAIVFSRLAEGSVGLAIDLSKGGTLKLRDKMLSLLQYAETKNVSSIFASVDDLKPENADRAMLILLSLAHDMLLLSKGCDSKVVHVDIAAKLMDMQTQHAAKLWSALYALSLNLDQTRLNFRFQLKSALIQVYCG